MPYQVKQIIDGKNEPLFVFKEELVSKALSLMIEHDYSQLPVVNQQDNEPEGMVTYESILRGIRNFQAKLDDLRVRDVMVNAPIYTLEDDLFDILDRLKDTNAVLITHGISPELVGIVTSYDTTEYFRNRTEDLMRVQEIELMVKDFIRAAYTLENGETDEGRLYPTIAQVTGRKEFLAEGKSKGFDSLTLNDYISILTFGDTWSFFEPIFCVSRDSVRGLLQGVREIRNALAHFRGDLAPDQRDRLKFCSEWMSRCQEEFQKNQQDQEIQRLFEAANRKSETASTETGPDQHIQIPDQGKLLDQAFVAEQEGTSRYDSLADWLLRRPGSVDLVQLTFSQVEEILGGDLPQSARKYRVWWANDSQAHPQSRHWLEAGWKTSYINMREEKVTFSRIYDREQAYITFYSKLLVELRQRGDFPVKDLSPDGASWMECISVPRGGPVGGSFNFSFSRGRGLRVELYLDLGDQAMTKAVFDRLYDQKEALEASLGTISWERLDNRRASRIAIYHEGQITEEEKLPGLRTWAAETMAKFYRELQKPAEQAIREVSQLRTNTR